MRRKRARLIAAAIVASVILTSVAHATFTITQNPASSEIAPFSTSMRIVVSVRNPMPTPQQMMALTRSPTGNANCPISVQITGLDPIAIPYSIPAYSQVQLVAFVNAGFTSGDPMPVTCVWDVVSSTGTQSFTTIFNTSSTSTVVWDLQPKLTDFGSQSETNDSENQKILINNYLTTMSSFTSMEIAEPSGSIRFVSDCLGQQTCTGAFMVGAKLGRPIEIACDPTSALTAIGTFTIYSASVPLASTMLTCAGTPGGGGGGLNIVQPTVDIQGPTGMMTGSNANVTSPMANSVVYAEITGADASRFTITNNNCNSQTCTFAPGLPAGPVVPALVQIVCTPDGTNPAPFATLLVRGPANDTDTATVQCTTTGGGGPSISVSPMSINGTSIPVGSMSGLLPVTVSNSSLSITPLSFTASVTDTANWSIDSCNPLPCAVGSGSAHVVNVTFHPTTVGPHLATLTLDGGAAGMPTVSLSGSGAMAAASVTVSPPTYPFGEVRVMTAERRLPFTIHNGGTPATIDFVRVNPARPGLSVTMIPMQGLNTGASLMGDVIVTPGAEVDLAGAFLEVGVGGETTRMLPITGTVVTPEATVTPDNLDLGTVCLGTQISGQVTMTNSGTATLHVAQPMMDQTSFTAIATPPDSYPLDLAPGADATISVTPSTSAMGMLSSELTWSVDAPGSPFRIPVALTYVTTGGAVSPNKVAFPAIDVDATSPERKITLQNCSDIPLPLTISGVVASSGDASAWSVTPRTQQRDLASKETVEVIVRFAPRSAGDHLARLVIDIGGEDRSVLLEGFADGDLRDRRSFYACTCSGPGAPSRGWPIAVAVILILRRRRR